MASSEIGAEIGGHPRPVNEEEEPPTKQLKLSEAEDGILRLPSLGHDPLDTTPAQDVGDTEEFPILIESENGENTETLIPDIEQATEAFPLVIESENEEISETLTETLIPDTEQVAVDNTGNSGTEQTGIAGDSDEYPIDLDSVIEDVNGTLIPEIAQESAVDSVVGNGSGSEQTTITEVFVNLDIPIVQQSFVAQVEEADAGTPIPEIAQETIIDSVVGNGSSTVQTTIAEVSFNEDTETLQESVVAQVAVADALPSIIDSVDVVDIREDLLSKVAEGGLDMTPDARSELAKSAQEVPENKVTMISTGLASDGNSTNGLHTSDVTIVPTIQIASHSLPSDLGAGTGAFNKDSETLQESLVAQVEVADALPIIIDSVDVVDIREDLLSKVAEGGVDMTPDANTELAKSAQEVSENKVTMISTASVSDGNNTNGLHTSDVTIVPTIQIASHSLYSDLGAGTSAFNEDSDTLQESLVAQVEESDALPMIIDSVDVVDIREALISKVAEGGVDMTPDASIELAKSAQEVSENKVTMITTASVSSGNNINGLHTSDVTIVPTIQIAGHSLPSDLGAGTSAFKEDSETLQEGLLAQVEESNALPMIIDSVDVVDIREALISKGAEGGVDMTPDVSSELAKSAQQVSENKVTMISTGSDSNGNSTNGLHTSDVTIVPTSQIAGHSLPADLGAGTSAVQRTKTSLCSYFRKKGCRHGAACRYAHGEEELKPRPDGSWDPTSERAKTLLLQKTAASAAPGVDGVKVVGEVPDAPVVKAPAHEEVDESAVKPLSKCIVHVPKGWSVDQFKTFLRENSISYTTAKKRKGMSVAFVGFKTPEDVAKATEILDGKLVNSKHLKVAESRSRSWEKDIAAGMSDMTKDVSAAHAHDDVAEGIDDAGLDCTVFEEGDVGDVELAAISREGPAGHVRNVCEAVTPLADRTYEEQLNVKRDAIIQVLKRLVRNTRKGVPSGGLLPDWILSARDKGGLPCALEGVLASPIIDGYRNKCEFSIGCTATGERVVGFQIGSFREGILAVAEPTDCRNVSTIARSYAAAFQEFVRQSELPVWNKKNNSGFWRLLIVREGRAPRVGDVSDGQFSSIAEAMLVVQVCPNGVEVERRSLEYAKMAEFLSHAASSASPPLPLTALIVQDHVGISNVASSDAPLHTLVVPKAGHKEGLANEYIHDHISNLQFRISPTAFFQVNTLAAERLYTLAGDWAGLTPDTLLFDVCCGTGTIGLTLAHRVGLVVGIEMNASAVADAQKNAEINNITNCRFVCSKAEDVMDSLLKEYLASEDEVEQTSSSIVTEKHEENPTEGVALVSSSDMETSLSEGRADAGQAEKAVCSGSGAECEPTRTANNFEQREGKQPTPKFKNIVAIVDPPRVGLHPVVLKTLRLHTELRRLVYISCNPQSLLANAVELCTPLTADPNTEKGKGGWHGRVNWKGMSNVGQARQRVKKMPPSEPFKPVKAIAVDLFPHTVHCEMVMLLER